MAPRDLGPLTVGIESQVGFPMRARFRGTTRVLTGHREVEVRVGEAGIAGQRTLEARDRFGNVAAVVEQEAEVVERLGLVGIDDERAPVELLGLALPVALE